MKEIIRILRQQLNLCQKLQEHTCQQKAMLLEHKTRIDMGALVKQIEPLLLELGQIDKRQSALLQEHKAGSVAELLERQPASVERSLANQLLHKVQQSMQDSKAVGQQIYLLLQRNQEFIDYNINVMNQTSADVTYTPPGAANLQAMRQKKMFDTSI